MGRGVDVNFESALRYAQKHFKLASKDELNPAAYYIAGMIYIYEKEDNKKALEYFLKGANLDVAPCQYEAALCYERMENSNNFEKYIMLAAENGDSDAMIKIGESFHYGAEDFDTAAKYYQLAIESGTDNASPYVGLCDIYTGSDNYESAIEYGEYALQNCEFYDETDLYVYLRIAQCYRMMEKYDMALAYAERAKEYHIEYADELYNAILKDKRESKIFGFIDAILGNPYVDAIPYVSTVSRSYKIGKGLGEAIANKDVDGIVGGIAKAKDFLSD